MPSDFHMPNFTPEQIWEAAQDPEFHKIALENGISEEELAQMGSPHGGGGPEQPTVADARVVQTGTNATGGANYNTGPTRVMPHYMSQPGGPPPPTTTTPMPPGTDLERANASRTGPLDYNYGQRSPAAQDATAPPSVASARQRMSPADSDATAPPPAPATGWTNPYAGEATAAEDRYVAAANAPYPSSADEAARKQHPFLYGLAAYNFGPQAVQNYYGGRDAAAVRKWEGDMRGPTTGYSIAANRRLRAREEMTPYERAQEIEASREQARRPGVPAAIGKIVDRTQGTEGIEQDTYPDPETIDWSGVPPEIAAREKLRLRVLRQTNGRVDIDSGRKAGEKWLDEIRSEHDAALTGDIDAKRRAGLDIGTPAGEKALKDHREDVQGQVGQIAKLMKQEEDDRGALGEAADIADQYKGAVKGATEVFAPGAKPGQNIPVARGAEPGWFGGGTVGGDSKKHVAGPPFYSALNPSQVMDEPAINKAISVGAEKAKIKHEGTMRNLVNAVRLFRDNEITWLTTKGGMSMADALKQFDAEHRDYVEILGNAAAAEQVPALPKNYAPIAGHRTSDQATLPRPVWPARVAGE